jgi:hypothetical protein
MVSMHMGDEDVGYAGSFDGGFAKLVLSCFAAVEEIEIA